MSRMRAGEWLAALGAVGLLVALFFDWFGGPSLGGRGWTGYAPEDLAQGSGWSSLGWFMVVLLCVAIVGGLAVAYVTATRTSPAWGVGAGVLAWIVGGVIFLALLVRVTIAQPGPDAATSVQLAAYLGLLAAALIPLGGFLSLRDERTQSPEALAYTPPPARPAPGG